MEEKNFRLFSLWPIEMPTDPNITWDDICSAIKPTPWKEVPDEFTSQISINTKRYSEFASFFPHARTIFYGNPESTEHHLKILYREDIQYVKTYAGDKNYIFNVEAISLYLFTDEKIGFIVVELSKENMSHDLIKDMLLKWGRTYPTGWEADGLAINCWELIEWLDGKKDILCASNFQDANSYIDFASTYKLTKISNHLEWLLEPFKLYVTNKKVPNNIYWKDLEYQNMPFFSWVAVNDLNSISDDGVIYTKEGFLPNLEWTRKYITKSKDAEEWCKYLFSDHNITIVGKKSDTRFTNSKTGIVNLFRHQFMLSFLLAHFQKTVLLNISKKLVNAMDLLNLKNGELQFKNEIKSIQEDFLRFTQRYWFSEIVDTTQTLDIFSHTKESLNTTELYNNIKTRITDIANYLENEIRDRQSNTMTNLTVVTVTGLIGSLVTGFLGMNIFDWTGLSIINKILYFFVVLIPVTGIMMYIISKSKQLTKVINWLALKNNH